MKTLNSKHIKWIIPIALVFTLFACQDSRTLKPVSVADFSKFVLETNYVTDAEKFGWSIVQEDVFNYRIENGATWMLPNGKDSTTNKMPVTQVSYNDALAYCKWANVSLPSYEDFWRLTKNNKSSIIQDTTSIHILEGVNVIGNVWDLTNSENEIGHIRLAGGSYLCNPHTCDGTNKNRILYVDKTTGNVHIGFSVIE